MNYTALARANIVIELFEDDSKYEALVTSTNGYMLQPYDTSTTLIGTVLRNNVDITSTIPNIRWTKWNPSEDNVEECTEWNKLHVGQASILITKDDIDSKSIFTFEAYDKYDKLLCSNSISLIDVNDLLASTNKPMNPYIGQLWIDDSTEPVNIYVWNGYKWVVSGSVGVIVNNLLYNTGFTYNIDKWDIVGEQKLMYTPTPHTHLERRYITLNSEIISDSIRGISQTTVEEVVKDSDYSFQMLFYSSSDPGVYSNNIIVNIYSIDATGTEVLIEEKIMPADKLVQRLFFTFKSRYNTEKFKVEIVGEKGKRFNFNIAEVALYNTHNKYPWTPNVKDSTSMLTQQNVWDALSNFGSVQGITSIKNEYTGQLEYYINASMINAGKVSAQYLDVYNLAVTRKDKPDVKTLEITDDGKISIRVSELKIEIGEEETPTEIQDYVGGEISASEDTLNNTINNTKNELEGNITNTKNELEGNIANTKNELESNISNTKTELQDSIDTTKSDLQNEISSTQETLQNNIDETNKVITDTTTQLNATINGIEQRVSNEETQTENIIEITKKGVYLSSYEDGSQSFANIDGDEIYIKSNSIKLEGYTTINGGFTVDTDGNMTANNGKFSGVITASTIRSDDSDNPVFSLTADGTLIARDAIISGEVGGIVPTSEDISSSNGKFIVHGESGLLYAEGATIHQSEISECTITDGSINIKDKFIVTADGRVNIKGFTGDMDDPEIKGGKINNATISNSQFTGGTIKDSTITDTSFSGSIANSTFTGGTISSSTINNATISNGTISGGTISNTTISNTLGTLSISSGGSITATSLNISDNITHNNNIIYKGLSNTFIASHYAIGSETNTIGEMSSDTLKLGQGSIACGTVTIDNITADGIAKADVSFSTAFSLAPCVTITLSSDNPNVNSSVSNVTRQGFVLNCSSSETTSATFYWLAVGAS